MARACSRTSGGVDPASQEPAATQLPDYPPLIESRAGGANRSAVTASDQETRFGNSGELRDGRPRQEFSSAPREPVSLRGSATLGQAGTRSPPHPSAAVVTASAVEPSAAAVSANSDSLTPLQPRSPASDQAQAQGGSSLRMLLSIGSSLLLVLSVFLALVWIYRKSMAASGGRGLAKQVVQVLGRTSIGPRQQLVLLRFGSKLVLVSLIQGEARTISEITDPLEVDQLAGQCESLQQHSMTQSFREILTQGGKA